MKKKFAIPMIAAVMAIAGAAAAFAAGNTYTVTGSVTPALHTHAKPSHPVAVQFGFDFGVSGNPPQVIKTYSISAYGVRVGNQKAFPKCLKFTNNSDAKCPTGAIVGTGSITNLAYAASNPSNQFQCLKSLRVYNAPGYKDPTTGKKYPRGVVLYLYGPGSQCGGISQSFVIPASFTNRQGGGTSLDFTVPENVRHPLGAGVLNVAVTHSQSTIKCLTATIKVRKTVRRNGRRRTITVKQKTAFFQKVNCLGGRTPLTVSFTDESNSTQTSHYNGILCS